jgi:radical SAM superfamily enzyme YgiQ (UPF0313 family)
MVEPLGLEAVSGGLNGHNVRLLDLRVEQRLTEVLEEFRPEICGISCSFTVDVYRALDVARVIKAFDQGSPPYVVVGGHHASLNPVDFHDRAVDAIAIGEGERTFAELAACLQQGGDPRSIQGLVLNTPSGQVRTGVRPLAVNLDSLPFPERALTKGHRKRYYLAGSWPLAVVETARGCPKRCNFCSVWQFYRGEYRAKSPTRVADEIEAVSEPYVLFSDDNFLADPERAKQIALALIERGLKRRYTFQARSDSIVAHPGLVGLWRQIGLESVFIGFEKISEDALVLVNKDNSVANNEAALELLHRQGISVTGSFIVDPACEKAEFEAIGHYVKSVGVDWPSFTVLTPLPGTMLYRQLRAKLLTEDYEMYDLLHAVLPTRVPLPEFYSRLAALYRTSYSRSRLLREQVRAQWRRLAGGGFSFSHLLRLLRAARTLTDTNCYLKGHRQPCLRRGAG